jgi:transposase
MEDAMVLYVGLDVSQKETEICAIDAEGRRVWRGKWPSRPEAIAAVLGEHAPRVTRVGMETRPLAIWLWHGLKALGIPIDCLHARHVAAALSLQVNKTDANDAHGIAQVVRSGWYRAVAVKSLQSCRVRAILSARRQLVMVRTGSAIRSAGCSRPSAWCSAREAAVCSSAPFMSSVRTTRWCATQSAPCSAPGRWRASARRSSSAR